MNKHLEIICSISFYRYNNDLGHGILIINLIVHKGQKIISLSVILYLKCICCTNVLIFDKFIAVPIYIFR